MINKREVNSSEEFSHLQRRVAELEVQLHGRRFFHLSWKRIGMFLLVLVGIVLCVGNFFLILSTWSALGIGDLKPETSLPKHLAIIWVIIGEYVLVSLTILQAKAEMDDSYNKLKQLSFGLIVGLIGGLIVGLIFGLIVGLIGGSDDD